MLIIIDLENILVDIGAVKLDDRRLVRRTREEEHDLSRTKGAARAKPLSTEDEGDSDWD